MYIQDDQNIFDWFVNGNMITSSQMLDMSNNNINGIVYAIRTDSEGCIAYTDTVIIGETEKEAHIKAYPNPVKDFVYVEFGKVRDYTISITGANGFRSLIDPESEELIQQAKDDPCGWNDIKIVKIKTTGLKPGLYVVTIISDDMIWNRTFIKGQE